MYNQIIPKMPFPWSNSIQITVSARNPQRKHSGQNDLMPGFCKTICAQDQNLYHYQICAISKFSPRIFFNNVASLPHLSHFLGLDPGQPADP